MGLFRGDNMTNKIQELTVNEVWRDEQDAWNHRSEYFVEMHNREDRKAQVTDFLAFLKEENLLPAANGRTLDVGCGVCDYALGLAREGYKATGIDLSDGMIRGAKQLAESEGLDLSLYIGPWSDEIRRELGWDKSFDLAYSIFCPIMFDVENIRAMHDASNDKCLWIAFSERSDEMVDMLSEHFFGRDSFPWDGKMKECLDAIHEMGRNVKVTYKTVPETEVMSLEKAVNYFTMRLHNNGWGDMEDMKEEIRNLIEPLAIDGEIHNKTVDKVAWVSWSVK